MKEQHKTHRPYIFAGGLMAGPALASDSADTAMRVLAELINTPNTTVYDKAIDSVYLQTHTGGSQLHHLIDGQHDIFGAFEAASRALPGDSLWQELMGTVHHLAKDLFSVSGLPVVSLKPESYHAATTWVSTNCHISKGWIGDLLQINALELFSGVLSVCAVVIGCKQADMQQLAELSAASGLAGLLAANPIALCAAAIALVMAWKHRSSSADLGKSLLVGAGTAGVTLGIGSALAAMGISLGLLPALGAILLSAVLGFYVRRFLVAKLYGKEQSKPDKTASPAPIIPQKPLMTWSATAEPPLRTSPEIRAWLHKALSSQ